MRLNGRNYFYSFRNITGTCLLTAGILLFAGMRISAQDADTTAAKTVAQKHSPRTATFLSLVIPGMGQVYNQKYWKVPIIYGAGGAFTYFIGYNQLKYKKFRDAYVNSKPGDKVKIDGVYYSYDNLPLGRDYYRRYRDLSVLGLGVVYLLNVVDAMIDAHFFAYDVSDDLTMRIHPAILTSPDLTASAFGVQINLGF